MSRQTRSVRREGNLLIMVDPEYGHQATATIEEGGEAEAESRLHDELDTKAFDREAGEGAKGIGDGPVTTTKKALSKLYEGTLGELEDTESDSGLLDDIPEPEKIVEAPVAVGKTTAEKIREESAKINAIANKADLPGMSENTLAESSPKRLLQSSSTPPIQREVPATEVSATEETEEDSDGRTWLQKAHDFIAGDTRKDNRSTFKKMKDPNYVEPEPSDPALSTFQRMKAKRDKNKLTATPEETVPSEETAPQPQPATNKDEEKAKTVASKEKKKGQHKDISSYDEHGFPIHFKGTPKQKEWTGIWKRDEQGIGTGKWNYSHPLIADALAKGKDEFAWVAADGKSRMYKIDPMPPQHKTEKKAIEIIKQKDPKKRITELKKANIPKVQWAEAKEATGNFYVDPATGFALDLNALKKRRDKKDMMDIAAKLPAGDRAAFFYQKGIINKEDVEAMLEPTEQEAFDRKVKEAQLKETNLKMAKTALEINYMKDPSEKDRLNRTAKLYSNAVTNDDFAGQIMFGRELGYSKDQMAKVIKLRVDQAKANPDLEKKYKEQWGVPYSKVIETRGKIMSSISNAFQPGQLNKDFQLGDFKYAGKKGLMENYGMLDHKDLKTKFTTEESLQQYFKNNFPNAPLNKQNKIDVQRLVQNPRQYEQAMVNALTYRYLNKQWEGKYPNMLKWYDEQTNDPATVSLTSKLTSTE